MLTKYNKHSGGIKTDDVWPPFIIIRHHSLTKISLGYWKPNTLLLLIISGLAGKKEKKECMSTLVK